jgi:CheY-like chemotaxis protein
MIKNLTKGFLFTESLKTKNINIIVCEDDNIAKMLLVKTLDKIGINSVTFFETADKLYEYIQNLKSIDKRTLIILDIKMPEDSMQGDELCKILRNENRNCKIIAATGLKTKTYNLQAYLNDGFNDVLFKPYTRNELIEVINNNI